MAISRWIDAIGRLSAVVGKSPDNPAVAPEMKDLGGRTTPRSAIVEDDGIDADENGEKLETEVRHQLQRLAPIGGDGLLAPQAAGGFPGHFNDHRRRHLEIVRIVRQHPLQIVSIPGIDPVLGESLCNGVVHGYRLKKIVLRRPVVPQSFIFSHRPGRDR